MIFTDGRKSIVLVVDDEPINIQILASLLNRDHEVKVACEGRAALDIAKRFPQPDLILLDIMMPCMDGFEVCRQLKADALTRDIPVIFVTAAGPESEAKCFELGAVDYIAKPINATIMRLRVQTQLDSVRLRKLQQQSLGFLNTMVDNSPMMIAVMSSRGQWLLINQRSLNRFGYADLSQAQTDLAAGHFNGLNEADFKRLRFRILRALVSGCKQTLTVDVSTEIVEVCCLPLRNTLGEIAAVCVLGAEFTDSGRQLSPERSRLLVEIFENAMDGMVISDRDGKIVDMNPAYCRILDSSPPEKPATPSNVFHSPTAVITANVENLSEADPEYSLAIYKEVAADSHNLQAVDVLTGLPNRMLLDTIIKKHIASQQRHPRLSAVCYLDLDGFTEINSNHGFDMGNAVLIECARRFCSAIRHSDVLGRLGGDEFVILLSELHNIQECKAVLDRILQAIRQPIVIGDWRGQLSVSIGVALIAKEYFDAETWLRQADDAMYVAKSAGKNCYHFSEPEEDQRMRMAGGFIKRLQLALEQGEFELFYQPRVRLKDQRLIGAEALVRWRDPERGVIAPGEFLPWLNGTNLEIQLGEWVIANALAQQQRWQQAGLELELSLNISSKHLQSPGFIDTLRMELANYPQLTPHSIQLEVLESSALEDLRSTLRVMQACRDLGVDFALDDFGTGYSSLTYLCKLPVKVIKIDQSFIRDMQNDEASHAIIGGIIALSKNFGREIVAEGIETDSHFASLVQMGCSLGQGYAIAKPMPTEAFWDWVVTQKMTGHATTLH